MNIIKVHKENIAEISKGDRIEIIGVNEKELFHAVVIKDLIGNTGTIIEITKRDKEMMYNNTDTKILCCRKSSLEMCMKNSKTCCYQIKLDKRFYNKGRGAYDDIIASCYLRIKKINKEK